jgi:uncharacterized protein YjbI with pentapeptide repeats
MNGEGETQTSNEARGKRGEYWAQLGGTIASLAAAIVAVFVAVNAFNQTKATEKGALRAADESRLSTAVNNLGAELPAQRLAGLALLRRLAVHKVESANEGDVDDSDRRDALRFFRATLNVLENYVNHPTPSSPSESESPPRPAVGDPQMSLDARRAANELKDLVMEKTAFLQLRRRFIHDAPFTGVRDVSAQDEGTAPPLPAIDLSHTTLYGLYWKGIDFSWLGGRSFVQADLRGASLQDSNWAASKEQKGADLTEAFMQCSFLKGARLQGAVLRFAHLEGADLTGAHLEGADLTGAHLQGAHLGRVHLKGAALDGVHVAGAIDISSGSRLHELETQPVPDDKQLGCDGMPAPT